MVNKPVTRPSFPLGFGIGGGGYPCILMILFGLYDTMWMF